VIAFIGENLTSLDPSSRREVSPPLEGGLRRVIMKEINNW
jgi:hypothetical protein